MALAGQNQVRHIYVAKSAKASTAVGDIDGGAVGDLGLCNANGLDAAVAAGNPFLLVSKETKGTVSSDVIKGGQVLYAKSKPYAARTSSVGTIGGITQNANTLYTVEIAISSHGSFSAENEYLKKAFYKSITGDDAGNIVDGLITSLNRNFARELGATPASNPYFNFLKGYGTQEIQVTTAPTADNDASISVNGVDYTVAALDLDTVDQTATKIGAVLNAIDGVSVVVVTDTVTITSTHNIVYSSASTGVVVAATSTASTATLVISEKLDWAVDQFNADKLTRQSIVFSVNASFTTLPSVISNITGNTGSGTYMQVAEMEFYLKGERGDFMRQAGYPHNLPAGIMEAVLAETYDIIEIGYYEEGRDEAKKSKKGITLAFPVSDRSATNVFIGLLNTAITSVGDITALA